MATLRSRAAAAALGAAALLSVPAVAGAAPTRTRVAAPATNPTYLVVSSSAGTTLAVSGTSNGAADPLDVRCDANDSTLLRQNVKPNAAGAWSIVLTTKELGRILNQTCYLRAVPADKNPPSRVNFAGIQLAVNQFQLTQIAGGPNNNGLTDFRIGASQLLGRGVFQSIGSCGMTGASVFQAATFFRSSNAFGCSSFLPINTGGRTGALVDGVSAYAASHVPQLFSGSSNLSGFQPVTYATSIDPVTGNVTVRELGTLVKCAPAPAIYPPTPASCSALVSAGVRYDRTWAQDHDGRFTVVTDSWYSTDSKPHQVDLAYETHLAGTAPAVSFGWQAGPAQLYGAGFVVPAPATVPATIYASRAVGTPDNDRRYGRGALTFKEQPNAIRFRDSGTIWLQYARTVPASGALRLAFIYARSTAQGEVSTLAIGAENALRPPPCIVPKILRMSVGAARTALAKANCRLGSIRHERSTSIPKNRIKWQRPKTGTVLANDAKIVVTLSVGAAKKAKR